MNKYLCRKIVLIFVLFHAFGLFSGCSLSKDSTRKTNINFPIKQAEQTTLTIYFDFPPVNFEEVIKEFEARTKDILNIKLIFKKARNGDKSVDFEKIINSQEPCDIICTQSFKELAAKVLVILIPNICLLKTLISESL